jgi:hypothetical protein
VTEPFYRLAAYWLPLPSGAVADLAHRRVLGAPELAEAAAPR